MHRIARQKSYNAQLAAIIFGGGRNFAVRRIFGYPHFFPADFRPAIIFFGEFGGWGLRVTSFAMDWRFTDKKSKQAVFSQSPVDARPVLPLSPVDCGYWLGILNEITQLRNHTNYSIILLWNHSLVWFLS